MFPHFVGERPHDVDDATAQGTPGMHRAYDDPLFGTQIWRYVQITNETTGVRAGMSSGELVEREDLITGIAAEAGSTDRRINHAAKFDVANIHQDDLVCILDDADGAEAAPEGQVRRVGSNTTGALVVDPNVAAFTAAVGTGDTATMFRIWKGKDATAANVENMLGILGSDATAGYFKWVLCWGFCDFAIIENALSVGALIAGAKTLNTVSTQPVEDQLGYLHATAFAGGSGNGTGGIVFINCLNQMALEE